MMDGAIGAMPVALFFHLTTANHGHLHIYKTEVSTSVPIVCV